MAMVAKLYSPLEEVSSQIRLLEIHPQNNDHHPVSCRMRTVSLDDKPGFFALSYVWGNSSDRVDIYVNGISLSVTRNLEAALRHVQQRGHGVTELDDLSKVASCSPRAA